MENESTHFKILKLYIDQLTVVNIGLKYFNEHYYKGNDEIRNSTRILLDLQREIEQKIHKHLMSK